MGIMPSHRSRSVGTAAVLLCVVILVSTTGSTEAQLQTGFYSKSCPKAEDIIRRFVGQHIPNAPSLAATLLRMHFHDCFVRVGTFPAVSFVGGLFLVQISDEKFVSSGLRCVGSPELDFEHPGGEDGHSEPNPQGFWLHRQGKGRRGSGMPGNCLLCRHHRTGCKRLCCGDCEYLTSYKQLTVERVSFTWCLRKHGNSGLCTF